MIHEWAYPRFACLPRKASSYLHHTINKTRTKYHKIPKKTWNFYNIKMFYKLNFVDYRTSWLSASYISIILYTYSALLKIDIKTHFIFPPFSPLYLQHKGGPTHLNSNNPKIISCSIHTPPLYLQQTTSIYIHYYYLIMFWMIIHLT